MNPAALPLTLVEAPDPVDRDLAPLLDEPLARAWHAERADAPTPPAAQALRDRLMQRVRSSSHAARAMRTTRRSLAEASVPTPGVRVRQLYRAEAGRALRPGEPRRARLVELAPGAAVAGLVDPGCRREWLVLSGDVVIGSEPLSGRDYRVEPVGIADPLLRSTGGAWVFVREADPAAPPGERAFTVRDAEAGWPDYAPGIRRRVLWQHAGQAAMLYCAQPGAQVPHHDHGHDEECLMVQGELFLDDVLLRAGDYQLAPAGTAHRLTETDTGVVLYAHGDLDLRFVA